MRAAANAWRLWLAVASLPPAAVLLAGCASQGPIRPPSLHIPASVTRLAATRTGDVVTLKWTNPTRATDGVGLEGKRNGMPLTAEICRETDPLPSPSSGCRPLARQPVLPGAETTLQDTLPAELADGPARSLRYRVRVLNRNNRAEGYAAVATVAGRAPAPVRNLRASAATDGAEVRWLRESSQPGERVELRVVRGLAKKNSTLLQIEGGDGDPGGAIDGGAKHGVEQRYTVYRVQTVTVAGRQLSLSSAPTETVLPADAVPPPPAAPTGLEAIANTLGTPEIDLVWQPSDGATGYVVYRAEGDGVPAPVTAEPVRGFSYADKTARRGVRYRYSVAAVGESGAPGDRSSDASETIPTQ